MNVSVNVNIGGHENCACLKKSRKTRARASGACTRSTQQREGRTINLEGKTRVNSLRETSHCLEHLPPSVRPSPCTQTHRQYPPAGLCHSLPSPSLPPPSSHSLLNPAGVKPGLPRDQITLGPGITFAYVIPPFRPACALGHGLSQTGSDLLCTRRDVRRRFRAVPRSPSCREAKTKGFYALNETCVHDRFCSGRGVHVSSAFFVSCVSNVRRYPCCCVSLHPNS